MSELPDIVATKLFGTDVADVSAHEPKSAPILGGTGERNEHEINSSLRDEFGPDGSPTDPASLHRLGGVPDVPDVPPKSGVGSSGTAGGTAGVPGVPAPAELIEAAAAGPDDNAAEKVVPSVPEDERPCFKVYDDWTLLDTGR